MVLSKTNSVTFLKSFIIKRLVLFVFILSSGLAHSQKITEAKTLTNAEEFATKSGILIEKVWEDVGKIKGVKVRIIKYTDLISNRSLPSLRFERETYSSYTKSTDTKIASLDKDEVDNLIRALEIISSKIITQKPENYTEVVYKSRGGFEAGCFYSDKKSWSPYMKLEKYDSKSYVFLDEENLPELIELIKKAKAIM